MLKNLSYSRYWAQKQGKEATAAARQPDHGRRQRDDGRSDQGGRARRCWSRDSGTSARSIRRRCSLTGLTRDGLFLIEKGKVTRPVKNMRWNESPIFALNNLDAMTPPERVVSGEGVGGAGFSVVCPAARIREFTFSSGSDAV